MSGAHRLRRLSAVNTSPACLCLICTGASSTRVLDAIDTDTVSNVGKHGVHLVGILAENDRLPYAFTTGLWHSYRSPEVAIFGLPARSAQACLSTAAESAKDNAMAADQQRDDVLHGLPVAIRRIDPEWHRELFGINISFYQGCTSVPFVQMFWPDCEGHFPWQPAFSAQFHDIQPQLWLAPSQHPRNAWTPRP